MSTRRPSDADSPPPGYRITRRLEVQKPGRVHPALRLCRHGFAGGVQVCLLLGEKEGRLVVRKWRSAAHRWTMPVTIPQEDIRGVPTVEICEALGVDMRKL